jgi:hypothetical protein
MPSIAISKLTDTALVATEANCGGSCPTLMRTRWYRRTAASSSFSLNTTTTSTQAIHPKVIFAQTSPTAGRFHTTAIVQSAINGGLRQVHYKSNTSDGSGQTGTFLTGTRNTPGPVLQSSCYWGDYDGINYSPNAGVIYFGFNQFDLSQAGSQWRGHVITNTP